MPTAPAALQAGAQVPPASGSSRMLIPWQGPSGMLLSMDNSSGVLQGHTQGCCWQVLAGYPGPRAWARAPHGSWSCFSLNGSSFSASPASIRDCPGELRGNGWSSSGAGARGAWKWPQPPSLDLEKGTAGMTSHLLLSPLNSPSCFIHAFPNKHLLPLGVFTFKVPPRPGTTAGTRES